MTYINDIKKKSHPSLKITRKTSKHSQSTMLVKLCPCEKFRVEIPISVFQIFLSRITTSIQNTL